MSPSIYPKRALKPRASPERKGAIVCIVATFIANAGEQLTAKAANQPTAAELRLLQGTWEGVIVGDTSLQRITITVIGNSLHFHRDKNFWFDTTITLPAGTDPKQLRATIKGCPTPGSIGQVVGAIFKIEDGTLTLATTGDEETPKSFEAKDSGLVRYELRKVQPQARLRPPNAPRAGVLAPSPRSGLRSAES